MLKFRQITSVRDNYDVDTEDEDFDCLTDEQIEAINKLACDDDCNPFKTFATYEEFEKDLIKHVEIGLEQIENGEYCTFEEFEEEIRGWFKSR